jgi:hypothetical protein
MTRKLTAVAAAVLLLAPASALPEEPPASPIVAPQWSIGAGLAGGGFTSGTTIIGGVNAVFIAAPVGASASLERSLGGGRWLVLGVALQGERSRNGAGATLTREDLFSADLTGGLRMALTEPGAPVEVSALLLGDVGASHTRVDLSSGGQTQDLASLGVTGGLAVQRELLKNLSLRLSTPIVSLSWAHSSTRADGGPAVDGDTLGFLLALRPTLELRLAF